MYRLLCAPGVLAVSWVAAGIPEHSCGPEFVLFTASHEHILQLLENSQYLWSIWKVRMMIHAHV